MEIYLIIYRCSNGTDVHAILLFHIEKYGLTEIHLDDPGPRVHQFSNVDWIWIIIYTIPGDQVTISDYFNVGSRTVGDRFLPHLLSQ